MIRLFPAAAVVAACAIFASCSGDDDDSATTGPRLDPARDAPRLIVESVEREAFEASRIEGTLLAQKCVTIRSGDVDYVAIWPKRTRLLPDGVEMDGHNLRFGSTVRLGGGEVVDDALETFGAAECGPTIGWAVGAVEEP